MNKLIKSVNEPWENISDGVQLFNIPREKCYYDWVEIEFQQKMAEKMFVYLKTSSNFKIKLFF